MVLIGCGEATPKKPLSPAEHFKKTQTHTMTPDGRVIPESVTEIGDGILHYKTATGAEFTIHTTPTDNGYRYSNAERVRKVKNNE